MILIYVTCKNLAEAKKIGLSLLKKRLAACFVTIPGASSFYFWPPTSDGRASLQRGGPPKKNRIEKSRETILFIKTLEKKFPQIEKEVKRLHSYTIPCILEISVTRLNKDYKIWLEKEIK